MRSILPEITRAACSGITLIEMTLVVSVLLGLISFSFLGANAYKRGTDRATCIIQVVEVQKGLRSYCNFNENVPGDTVPNLKGAIIGPGKFVDEMPVCPSGGTYQFSGNVIPDTGNTFMSCLLEGHTPATTEGW
ncbi:MAG: hypothetical protein P1U68_13575 [Verrucomicrobiales bacterium]|nr:hypothetical protein [Verrucomicrobiales bacterium]